MNLTDIIIKPLITEKSMAGAGKNKFTFAVSEKVSKGKIKKAIEDKYKVNIVSIATNVIKGRKKRVGKRRMEVADLIWKKAVIQLKEGQKIDLFESVK